MCGKGLRSAAANVIPVRIERMNRNGVSQTWQQIDKSGFAFAVSIYVGNFSDECALL